MGSSPLEIFLVSVCTSKIAGYDGGTNLCVALCNKTNLIKIYFRTFGNMCSASKLQKYQKNFNNLLFFARNG